jgi:hypothetical protein
MVFRYACVKCHHYRACVSLEEAYKFDKNYIYKQNLQPPLKGEIEGENKNLT